MAEASRLVSVRLKASDIEQLKARAFTLSAKVSGVARDLILTGLAGGDPQSQAQRLMLIERRLAALEQLARDGHRQTQAIEQASRDLRGLLDALLQALAGDGEPANERRMP
jgi:hypothetical protein